MFRFLSPVIFDRFSEFFIPDPGSGSGGGNGNHDDDDEDELEDPPTPITTGNAVSDQVIRDYFDRNQAWIKRQRRIVGGYRRATRTAETTLATERENVAKKAVIEPSDLTAYEAYKAFGTVDQVKAKITEGETAASRVANLERDTVLRDAANAEGYNLPVLRDRVGTQVVQVREVETDGQKTLKAFITAADGKEYPLSEFAEKEWSVYLPALHAPDGNGNSERVPAQQSQQQFPGQNGNRGNGRNNSQAVSAYMGSVYKGPPKRGS